MFSEILEVFTSKTYRQLSLFVGGFLALFCLACGWIFLEFRAEDYLEMQTEITRHLYPDRAVPSPAHLAAPLRGELLNQFVPRFLVASIIAILLILIGLGLGYYFVIGRYFHTLLRINFQTDTMSIAFYPQDRLPNNEFRQIVESREKMLNNLLEHQRNIDQKLREAKNELYLHAKLSLIGEMAGSVAHDLRNPLTVLSVSMDRARERLKEINFADAGIEKIFTRIDLAQNRLNSFITRLNNFNKHTPTEEKCETPLSRIFETSLILLEPKIHETGAVILMRLSEPDLCVVGFETKLEQVVINLLANAMDAVANQENREITLEAEGKLNRTLIHVTDYGTGIAASQIPEIFKPFYTTKEGRRGTGFGLSICKRIVEEHNGDIYVVSAPKQGTRFTVSLPT